MIYTASIDSRDHLDWAIQLSVKEVVISVEGLSREGGLSVDEAKVLAETCLEQHLSPVLLVDRLVEQREYSKVLGVLAGIKQFKLRVQDIGLANWLHEQDLVFQLILDVGNANAVGIARWKEYFGSSVDRFVLNNEIPKEHLLPILSSLEGESELLGLGPIMIYYSPRKLFSYQGIGKKEENVVSDETGQKTFRCRENSAGFVMYYSKELCLLPYREELAGAQLGAMRLDFRTWDSSRFESFEGYFSENIDYEQFKSQWPESLLHGYYKTNKSDSVFDHLPKKKKLKGERIIAEVIDQSPHSYLLKLVAPIKLDQIVKAVDTKGNLVNWSLGGLKNLNGDDLISANSDDLVVIKKLKKVFSGSFIYSTEDR